MSSLRSYRCNSCLSHRDDNWAWQPFGPGVVSTLTTPGAHYRGFPVLRLCPRCKRQAEREGKLSFSYRDKWFIADWSHDQVSPLIPRAPMSDGGAL